jgi:hypothetical protein
MKHRYFFLSGTAATVVYVVAVILGGFLRPGYSHVTQAVSELLEAGAPNTAVLDPLFLLYNLLTVPFAAGVFLLGRESREHRPLATAAAMVLLLEAVAGFVTVFFPQDVPGTPFTITGSLHIGLAGISSLTTMAAMLLVALWFRRTRLVCGFALYSLLSLVVVFVTGGVAAATTALNVPVNGLAERITIGGFLQWMLVVGLGLTWPPRPRGKASS